MNIALVLMSVLSIFSIFACFGEAVSVKFFDIGPSMFDLMFGLKINESYAWKRFDGLTFLFFLEVVIILLAFALIVVIYKNGEQNKKITFGGISALLSLIAAIISFCCQPITSEEISATNLGVGAIIFGIMHILAIVSYFVAYLSYKSVQTYKWPTISTSNINSSNNQRYSGQQQFGTNQNFSSNSNNKTEEERIKLLKEYKTLLDEGIITKEEFEEKKKTILK